MGAVEHDDQVGHAHRREAMRDENRDAAAAASARGAREALEQRVLGLGVERRGGLIEDEQHGIVTHEAAGERELLPLAVRDIHTTGPRWPELRVEAGYESIDDIGCTRALDGRTYGDRVIHARNVAYAHRVLGTELELVEILERAGEPRAPRVGVHACERN